MVFVFFLALIPYFYSTVLVKNNPLLSHKNEKVDFSVPIRLTIPKINVDAFVETVSLAKDGAMDVPKGPNNTAWFDLGPRPGESGSAVIAGHSGWKGGEPAVFDNLNKLNIGDKLYIEGKNGITAVFVIHKIKTYDLFTNPSDVFSSTDGKSHLNLITCNGIWDKVSKNSSGRLVVFADMETK